MFLLLVSSLINALNTHYIPFSQTTSNVFQHVNTKIAQTIENTDSFVSDEHE